MIHGAFWQINDSNRIAIIDEEHRKISYSQLAFDIEKNIKLLPRSRSLVLLKASNTYKSLVNYLSCLNTNNPMIIVDRDLDSKLIHNLQKHYKVNLILDEHECINIEDLLHLSDKSLALMLSTSGTTGDPKLVRLSYKNISENSISISEYLNIKPSDIAITTLPMSYSYGLSVINSHLQKQACIVLNSEPIISKKFWTSIGDYNVTTFSGVPFTFEILKRLKYEKLNNSSINYLTQAGGKLNKDTLEYFFRLCKKLGQEFIVMYGQTEASPRISYLPFEDLDTKMGSIGIPIPNGALSISDSEGRDINKPFTEGEISYKGPNVMLGYATSTDDLSLGDTQNGILRTGDIGYFDPDNYFFITGRVKRFIKLFGLRVNLDSIDEWLTMNNYDAVSMGDDEHLKIYISRDQEKDKGNMLNQISSLFKINQKYISTVVVDDLPRNKSGKVKYKELIDIE